MSIRLSLTDRALTELADGTARGIRGVTFTRLAIGSGIAPARADDSARAALRHQRETAAATGNTAVAGRIAVEGRYAPAAAYDVTEIGLFARRGAGAEWLAAYWAADAASGAIARTVAGEAFVLAGVVEVEAAAAEISVTANPTIHVGSGGFTVLAADVALQAGRVQVVGLSADATAFRWLRLSERVIDPRGSVGLHRQADYPMADVRLDAADVSIETLWSADRDDGIQAIDPVGGSYARRARIWPITGFTRALRSASYLDPYLYLCEHDPGGREMPESCALHRMDLATGTIVDVATSGQALQSGMAYDGRYWFFSAINDNLYSVPLAGGASRQDQTVHGANAAKINGANICRHDGATYAIGRHDVVNNGRYTLWTVDLDTGALTEVGDTGLNRSASRRIPEMASGGDDLFVLSDGILYTLDPNNGKATRVAALPGVDTIFGPRAAALRRTARQRAGGTLAPRVQIWREATESVRQVRLLADGDTTLNQIIGVA